MTPLAKRLTRLEAEVGGGRFIIVGGGTGRDVGTILARYGVAETAADLIVHLRAMLTADGRAMTPETVKVDGVVIAPRLRDGAV